MEMSFFLGIVFGLCLTLLVFFFIRDVLFKHYINMLLGDAQVQPVVNSEGLLKSMKGFIKVLESTGDTFTDVLKFNTLTDKEREAMTFAKDTINDNIEELSTLVKVLDKEINHE